MNEVYQTITPSAEKLRNPIRIASESGARTSVNIALRLQAHCMKRLEKDYLSPDELRDVAEAAAIADTIIIYHAEGKD